MTTQLERLQQDIIELEQYITKLKDKGKMDVIKKMDKKMLFLQSHYSGKQIEVH
jgi:uncharacterized membrane protein (DUF106 family)